MTDNLSIPIQITFAQLLDAVDQLSKPEQHQLLLHVLRRHEEDNLIVTHFASETVLAKDWNNSIEDEVWRDLYLWYTLGKRNLQDFTCMGK